MDRIKTQDQSLEHDEIRKRRDALKKIATYASPALLVMMQSEKAVAASKCPIIECPPV